MTWFEQLMGLREITPAQVRDNIVVDGDALVSQVNGRRHIFGRLETPTLGELRHQAEAVRGSGRVCVREVIADAQALHADPANTGALIQVASQFNLLEMMHPSVTPERGVGIYEHDRTQGPACAIACGAGTIYRNYFVDVDGQIGQAKGRQIDCSKDLSRALGDGDALWTTRNGYVLPTESKLEIANRRLAASKEADIDAYRGLLRIGLQWDAEVTLPGVDHRISQAYCSAMPVSYSGLAPGLWEPLARLVLEAAYEATLCAALINRERTGSNRVYLTLLGGGAFGNLKPWIIAAIDRALRLVADQDLDVAIVSHRQPNPDIRHIVMRSGSG